MHSEPRYAFALHRVTSCDIGFTHAVPILSFATKTEVDPCQFSSVGGTRGGLRYGRRIALQDQIRGRDGFPPALRRPGDRATLAKGWRPAGGGHTVHWNGRDGLELELANGVYLYRMEPESRWTGTWKLLLLR